MKKTSSALLVFLLLGVTYFATAQEQPIVKNFSGIVAGGPIDVVVTLGDSESCRFEGDAEAIATLLAQVEGTTLVIRPQMSWKSWERKYSDKKITAYVSAKKLSSFTMSGSGSMEVKGAVNTGELSVVLSGSGNLSLSSKTKNLNAVISGSGKLNITGEADNATITLSGSAIFAGKDFSVSNLSAQMSGSGKVNIEVSENINAVISGSASIFYTGDPEVKQTILGSGKVKKV
ncbi:putative membrane protein [Pedobacter sp. UYP30]|uniref:head GIN domain-containing protein n=1 Tax=Pedobacter sp. UYP30 TaxID=1756400 RepID=UPI00339099F7